MMMRSSSIITGILILFLTVNLGSHTASGEVQKDFIVKDWWSRFLLWLVSRFQDKYDGQLSICSLSLYPPFEDIDLLELMMSMRFGQQSRRKTPITPGSRQRPKSKRSTFDDFSSIVEDPVEELDEEVAKPIGTNLQSEPIVRILPSGRVCFGVHELSHRVPKEAPKRKDFMSIINSFITYVNHQNKYPTKIGHIDI